MRRWLYVWGPPVVGIGLASVFGSAVAACAMGHHWLLIGPSIAGGIASLVGMGIGLDGASDRAREHDRVCWQCQSKAERLAAVTKDRDELREALATLQLEAAPSRTPDREPRE